MKKIIRTVALFTAMSMVAVGCQKEPMLDFQTTVSEESSINITYAVDGVTHQASFACEDEWQDFLVLLFTWAEEGRDVSFYNTNSYAANAKQNRKVVTFTTNSKEEAIGWADAMEHDGYTVRIDYDDKTGIYTCTAVK